MTHHIHVNEPPTDESENVPDGGNEDDEDVDADEQGDGDADVPRPAEVFRGAEQLVD